MMVQMAKALGAYVIGTASESGSVLAKSFGADEVINYKKDDFSELVTDVDLAIDMVGNEFQPKLFKIIKKGGLLLSATLPPSQDLAHQYGVNALRLAAGYSHTKLDYGMALLAQGGLRPVISRLLKLADAAKAQDLVSAGGIDGKVVLEVD